MKTNDRMQILASNITLILVARFAIVFASVVGLPVAGWLLNRAVNTADQISTEVVHHTADLALIKQSIEFQGETLKDHEARLRMIEATARLR